MTHFDQGLKVLDGKAMVVCMSRRICIDLYRELVRLRPDWHDDDDAKGRIKVVMTGAASDPADWQPPIRNKPRRATGTFGGRAGLLRRAGNQRQRGPSPRRRDPARHRPRARGHRPKQCHHRLDAPRKRARQPPPPRPPHPPSARLPARPVGKSHQDRAGTSRGPLRRLGHRLTSALSAIPDPTRHQRSPVFRDWTHELTRTCHPSPDSVH